MKVPKMTRQHFEFIAGIIKGMPTHAPTLRAQKVVVAARFARELKQTNPKFQDGTFLEACGMEFTNGVMCCEGYTDPF